MRTFRGPAPDKRNVKTTLGCGFSHRPDCGGHFNQIERFFALLSEKQIKRGVHRSTQHLERDIRAFIEANNAAPKPFIWTKGADTIIRKYERAKRNLISRAAH